MFSEIYQDFNERVREVDLYLQILQALDNCEMQIVAGQSAPQIVPVGDPPIKWERMLKGAAYLVLYNLVEAFIRRGFEAVFDEIYNSGISGSELTSEMFKEWVKQRNKKIGAFDGSPKKYMEIAHEIISDSVRNAPVRLKRKLLPFPGNLDATAIRKVCHLHGIESDVSAQAMGGQALTLIKKKRNTLSHGDESFEEVGRMVSVGDAIRAKDELVHFVKDMLQNMENFVKGRKYKSSPTNPSHLTYWELAERSLKKK